MLDFRLIHYFHQVLCCRDSMFSDYHCAKLALYLELARIVLGHQVIEKALLLQAILVDPLLYVCIFKHNFELWPFIYCD